MYLSPLFPDKIHYGSLYFWKVAGFCPIEQCSKSLYLIHSNSIESWFSSGFPRWIILIPIKYHQIYWVVFHPTSLIINRAISQPSTRLAESRLSRRSLMVSPPLPMKSPTSGRGSPGAWDVAAMGRILIYII